MRSGATVVLPVVLAACPEPGPPPPADAAIVGGDFATRCAAPGVIRCLGFDDAAEIAGHVLTAGDNAVRATIDPAVAASGTGALRFELPANIGPNSAGAVWFNLVDDLSAQFGEGSAVHVQWRQRFSPAMLRAFAVTGAPAGWHQLGLGEGDQPGDFPVLSCTELEIVVEQAPAALAPTVHHDCENRVAIPPATVVPHRADEWMTFQLGVAVGTWNTPTSYVELRVAAEGAAQEVVLAAADVTLHYHPGTTTGTRPGARYGKLWIEPFIAGKDPAEDHPTAYTWYDELIVARQRIGDPAP